MSLTYQFQRDTNKLERLEWDRTWFQDTQLTDCSRLIMIGDSIANGITETFNDVLHWKYPVDSYTSSKALDNPALIPTIRVFMSQETHYNAIVFNNGLHGFHLADETEYAQYYEKIIAFLQETYPDKPLYLSLTTYLRNPEQNERVIVRNKVSLAIAEKFDLPVIDLYSVAKNNADLLARDGVHFTSYKPLCEEIQKHIMKHM